MFDPYHKWLGIPKKYRPPTYYQLLGISPQEDDSEVIEEAAIRQLAHLRTYQIGEHGELCTKLLNEVSQARTVLLDPVKRKKYDAELTKKGIPLTTRLAMPEPAPSGLVPPAAAPAAPLVPPRPVPAAPVAPPPAAAPSAFADLDVAPGLAAKPGNSAVRKGPPPRAKAAKPGAFAANKTLLLAGVGGGVVLLLLLILIPVLLLGGGGKDGNDPTKNPVAQNGGKGKNNQPKENELVQPGPEPNPNPVPIPNPMPNPQPGPGPVVNPEPGDKVIANSKFDPEQAKEIGKITSTVPITDFCLLPGEQEVYLMSNRVEKWNLKTQSQVQNFGTSPSYTSGNVAVSPDHSQVLYWDRDSAEVRLVDAATGNQLAAFPAPGEVRGFAFLPDGKRFAVVNADILKIWDIATKQEWHAFAEKIALNNFVRVSPDGKKVCTGDQNGFFRIWNLDNKSVERLQPGESLSDMDILPDGTFILATSRFLYLGNLKDVNQYKKIDVPWENQPCVALSPDGKYAIRSGRSSNTIKLVDLEKGQVLHEFSGPTGGTYRLRFSADGQKFFSSSHDKTLRVWQLTQSKQVAVNPRPPDPGPMVPPMPDPNPVAPRPAAAGEPTLIHDVKATTGVVDFCVLPGGREVIVTGSQTRRLDLETQKPIMTYGGVQGGYQPFTSIQLAPDARTFFCARMGEKVIRQWDVATGEELGQFEGHEQSVRGLAVSPDGKKLISIDEKTIRIWNVATREFNSASGKFFSDLTITPDGKKAVVVANDKLVTWDLDNPEKELVTNLPYAHWGQTISPSMTGTFALKIRFKVEPAFFVGKLGQEAGVMTPAPAKMTGMALSPDGKHIVASDEQGFLYLFDADQPRNYHKFPGHKAAAPRIRFSSDGKFFYSGGLDSHFKVWQMPEQNDAAAGPRPAAPEVPPALPRPQLKVMSAKKQANGDIILDLSISNWADYEVLFQPKLNPPPEGALPKKSGVSVQVYVDGQERGGWTLQSAKTLGGTLTTILGKRANEPKTVQIRVIDPRDKTIYKSEAVPVPLMEAGMKPGLGLAVDLRPDFQKFGLFPKAQGVRDTCSLFAITSLASFEYSRQTDGKAKPLSEEFLVWAANEASGRSGDQAMFYEAVHGLNQLGVCTADLMPYLPSSDANRKPSPEALADAKTRAFRWKIHWIKRWDLKNTLTEDQLTAIKQALSAGHPVACGLRWAKNAPGPNFLTVPPTNQVFDGHSIVFVGYRDDPAQPGGGTFFFRNSSGPGWGNGGYGLMSYSYVRTYANDALWLQFGSPDSEKPLYRFEAENLPILSKSKSGVNPQGMAPWGAGLWSQGKHLFCGAAVGGSVLLGFTVPQAGQYRLRVQATAAPDFGIVRVSVNNKPINSTFDLYSGRVCPSGSLELGNHFLTAGQHHLHFLVVGKNPASTNFYFGLDTIDLLPTSVP